MTRAVVTGANRGIGWALTEALLARGVEVLAACREPSAALEGSGAQVVAGVDVTEPAGIARLVEAVGKKPLDLLINNAGILLWNEDLGKLEPAGLERQFQVNAVAPLLLTQALAPQLAKGSKVALITSRMGSIADNGSGGHYGYRMSKAALNAAGMSLARDLAPRGVAVAILHPGMVSTDMIGGRGQISPADAARQLLARIDQLSLENTGTFWHANGEVLPW
jgi:NAD(P)-dependent dehydrogenase (short-subunit alcohol dehydrogenase family)